MRRDTMKRGFLIKDGTVVFRGENHKLVMPYNLQFFAKEGAGGEKTEDATAKKLTDARKEGQTSKSTELVTATMLIGLFLTLKVFIGFIGTRFLENFASIYKMISIRANDEFSFEVAHGFFQLGLIDILVIALPIYLISFLLAFIVNIYQVKWQITAKPLMPKLNKISPIGGFKRLFSKDKIMELLKSTAKIVLISYVVYDTLKDKWGILFNLYEMSLTQAILYTGDIVIDLGLKISVLFLIVALVDVFYQKRKFKEDMKMTKQEIKDEYKNSEGDPQIKGKIKQRMLAASQRRMMQELPQADVVITNPTHLAVAIKYDKEAAEAPLVIAKGADYLANKIKEVARENQIEIVENKPLARMLYYNVEIGNEIPQELYQMVAEVLAYVYGLKGKL